MKISIITINYNNSQGLKRTIESVINQTYNEIEYIIIDGGSTDESLEIIKRHQTKINYWISEPDKGIYNAMNKGVMQASGDYLLFLNSGDWLCNKNVMFNNIQHLKENQSIIYFNIYYVDTSNGVKKLFEYPDKLSFYFFFNQTICQQSIFFKKDLFENYGLFRDDLKIISDWEFIMRCIVKHEENYRHINNCFSYAEDGGYSSENMDLLHLERDSILKKDYAFYYDDYTEFTMLKFYFKKYKLNKIREIYSYLRDNVKRK